MDTSEYQPVYAVSAEAGRYFRVSQRALLALRLGELGASPAEMAAAFADELKRPVTEDEAAAFCRDVKHKYETLLAASGGRDAAFLFKLPIFSAPAIDRVGRYLAAAFGVTPAVIVLAVAVIGLPLGFQGGRISAGGDLGTAALAYALFLISAMLHEFGHASACLRFGSKPKAIGLTVYAMFPAFYTDVSDAWLLKRWQRVVVDLGGSYFQLGVGGLYGIAYALSGARAFHWATMLILATSVFNLNPIFKFDGYWVVADALGVTNLSAYGRRAVRSVLSRSSAAPGLPLPRRILVVLVAYGGVSIGIWVAFTGLMTRALFDHVRFFNRDFGAAISVAHGFHVNWALVPPAVFALGASCFTVLFLSRLLLKGIRFIRGGMVPRKGHNDSL